MPNSNMIAARKAKNDEFYTQLSDIELELIKYREHFRGKVVYCNCDDARSSAFFKYFAMGFNILGLKKLITTSYNPNGCSSKIEIVEVEDFTGDGRVGLEDAEYLLDHSEDSLTLLEGDGDFRSEECVSLMQEADIIVTNPPFSLFREFVSQLIEHDKQFLILGNINAITYREIFPLLKENRMWLGVNANKTMEFRLADSYLKWSRVDDEGNKYGKVPGITWYTNLEHGRREEELLLYKRYTPEEYPHYDNYDAINVNRVANIPLDYDGVMGVPITFMTKYNPEQFEILGDERDLNIEKGRGYINGKRMYGRIFIKRKEEQQ